MAEQMHVPLDEITLRKGSHNTREDGVCFMEAAAWFAGEPHSDTPACVCPVLGAMGRSLNDTLPDEKRIRMLPFVPRVAGTAGDGMGERRGFMAADWIIRTYTPTWLRLAGLDDEAAALEALPEVVDTATMEGSLDALNRAHKGASAAPAAAWAAARAAWVAAWEAAVDAARDANAAREVLAPTVSELQDSAIELYGRMCSLRPDDGKPLVTPLPTEAKVGA